MGMGSSVLTDVPGPKPWLQGLVGDMPPGTTSCILCEFIPRPTHMSGYHTCLDITVAGLVKVNVASVMVASHFEQLTVQAECQKMKKDHCEHHLLLNVACAAFL